MWIVLVVGGGIFTIVVLLIEDVGTLLILTLSILLLARALIVSLLLWALLGNTDEQILIQGVFFKDRLSKLGAVGIGVIGANVICLQLQTTIRQIISILELRKSPYLLQRNIPLYQEELNFTHNDLVGQRVLHRHRVVQVVPTP